MAATLKQNEELPETYPTVADVEDANHIWQRIESYIAHRWTPRQVVWHVEGSGDWYPPLGPVSDITAERWAGVSYHDVSLNPVPSGGHFLPTEGDYRITAMVGGGTLPEAVKQAFLRLHRYSMDETKNQIAQGASSASVNIGPVNLNFNRSPAWLGRAMINSGAADLLRPYRRF